MLPFFQKYKKTTRFWNEKEVERKQAWTDFEIHRMLRVLYFTCQQFGVQSWNSRYKIATMSTASTTFTFIIRHFMPKVEEILNPHKAFNSCIKQFPKCQLLNDSMTSQKIEEIRKL